jgi:hypothetical protein
VLPLAATFPARLVEAPGIAVRCRWPAQPHSRRILQAHMTFNLGRTVSLQGPVPAMFTLRSQCFCWLFDCFTRSSCLRTSSSSEISLLYAVAAVPNISYPYFMTGPACLRCPRSSMNHADQSRRRWPSIGLYSSNTPLIPLKAQFLFSAYLRGPILMQLLRGCKDSVGNHRIQVCITRAFNTAYR